MQQEHGLEVIRGAEQAAALFQPTRRLLLAHLGEPQTAAGLSRKLGLPRQRLNYHLKELERQGLVECVEERRKGNCTERLMRVTARSFVISPEALGAVGKAEAAGDRFSAAYAVGLAARVINDVSTLEARARGQGKRLATFAIETELRFPTAQARAAFAEQLTAAIAELVARHHDARAPGGRSFRLVTAVHPVLVADAGAPAPPREPTARRRR